MIKITEQDFDNEVLKCELPVFVCFTTRGCHNCYPTCLFANQLVNEYDGDIKFVELDIEKSPGIKGTYHVIAVPTILIFNKAQEVHRLFGFQELNYLRDVLDKSTTGYQMSR